MYTLKEIATHINGRLSGTVSTWIKQLAFDSRSVIPAGDVLFFCIKGPRNDGHDYIDELYARGIKNFVVEHLPGQIENYKSGSFLLVKDTVLALQQLAAFHRSRFNCPILGITGSNGKTIIKEWAWHSLHAHFRVTRNPKSYNSQVGVPLSVWLLNEETEIGIFEAGISKPGEMKKLQAILKPTIGIFTNVGEAHQENFKDLNQKAREKAELFKNCKTIIYCKEHKLIEEVVKKNLPDVIPCCWSEKTREAFLFIEHITKSGSQTQINAITQDNTIEITIPFIDDASIENALHVLTLLMLLHVDPESIKNAMESLPPVAMRLELKKAIRNSTLINDSYNSDINSLAIALDYLALQKQHKEKTLILSDILQSGQQEKELYKQVASMVQEKGVHHFYGIGPALKRNQLNFPPQARFFGNTDEFLDWLKPENFSNQAILLKGARNFEFEKISKRIEEQVHKTIMEINLNGMVHNLNFYKSLLKSETKVMVMLKAFAYGSGSYEVANVLQHNKVDYFGVAFIDEGIVLRKAGIKTPIMVMNPEPAGYESIPEHNLEPELFSFESLTGFHDFLEQRNINSYPMHLKIDTGMHRLGFTPDIMDKLCRELKNLPRLKITSVFSHLAGSDSAEFDTFTHDQITIFLEMCQKLGRAVSYPFMKHILNSAGIERFTPHQMDMVRLGIGLYGVSPLHQHQLQPTSTLKSKIIQIKDIGVGDTVGYSRKGKLAAGGRIAVVPIGYADGLDRKLSNGAGYFMVNGQEAPIIGNICMDMTMIDVTNIHAGENDEVIIFGEKPTVAELAESLQTIPYEIFTSISPRVKRVYLHD